MHRLRWFQIGLQNLWELICFWFTLTHRMQPTQNLWLLLLVSCTLNLSSFSLLQSLSCARLFATQRTAAHMPWGWAGDGGCSSLTLEAWRKASQTLGKESILNAGTSLNSLLMRWNSASTTPPPSSLFLESESHSVMSDSLRPHGLYSPWNSPGQNTGVGSLCLLQGIFPTQGSNPGLLHCRWIFYQLSHKGSPCSLKALVIPGRNSLESLYPCCRVNDQI